MSLSCRIGELFADLALSRGNSNHSLLPAAVVSTDGLMTARTMTLTRTINAIASRPHSQ